MGVTWDDLSDKRMLLCMIHTNITSISNYEQVAKMMGDEYTAESIRQRFRKVKAKAKEEFGEPGTPKGGEGAAPKTPVKRGGKKAADESVTKSTGKRKAKKAAAKDEETDEDDAESRSKKVKTEPEAEDGNAEYA